MTTTAVIIFIITFLGIIFTRLPKLNIDRPSAAFFGAVAMIVFGVVTFEEAVASIDYNTIGLLLGMMIIIAVLEIDGFFTFIAEKTISLSNSRFQLLFIIVLVTGVASAFLVNDAVVLLFTPVIIKICRSAKLNPVPYLIAEIFAANIGSTMAITGNPQNILIGINSGIPYGSFLLHLMPISVLGLLVTVLLVRIIFSKDFSNKEKLLFHEEEFEYDFLSMKFSVPIFALVLLFFFFSKMLNLSIPVIALSGASLILILGRVKPSKVIKEVDWVLLLFFAGLFIVVHGIEKAGVLNPFIEETPLTDNLNGIVGIHTLSLFMSQIVSNVPYTILMLPILKAAQGDLLWLSLASAATLAGNATIIGAIANLIVIESAKSYGVEIKFWEFTKAGIMITLLTMIISVVVLYFQFANGNKAM
ncbi:MAG: anion transporter [Ignavibacteriaceae bacterium]|nr:anion transporter [Ignavibacteriaceae bacterium]